MKKLKNNLLLLLFIVGFICGCGVYEPIDVVPDHIQTLRILPLKNETQQIRLTSELTEEIINEFTKEGRLTIVNSDDANATLDVTIIEYSKIPIAYDENFVAQEYKLNMIVNLKLYDHVDNVKLWEDERKDLLGGIETDVKYYVGTDTEFPETEDEARERLIEDMAKKILHRVVYGWE